MFTFINTIYRYNKQQTTNNKQQQQQVRNSTTDKEKHIHQKKFQKISNKNFKNFKKRCLYRHRRDRRRHIRNQDNIQLL